MIEALQPILKYSPRQLCTQILNFGMVVSSALMIWKGLSLFTNTESPIVVVLSESMEPAFQRGDLLFLTKSQAPLRAGDICVYKLKGKDIPIVHRILEVHEPTNGTKAHSVTYSPDILKHVPPPFQDMSAPVLQVLLDTPPLWLYDPFSYLLGLKEDSQASQTVFLTKGDNNRVDDRALYNSGQLWLEPGDVMGRVAGHLPYVGMVTIVLNDYPQLKIALLVTLAMIVLLTKEE